MSKQNQNKSEFKVVLEGITFSKEATARIEAGIQALVMDELVGYKPDPDAPDKPKFPPVGPLGDPIVIFKPRPWPGLIIRRFNDLNYFKELEAIEKGIR